jgi:hypothetical protein
MTELQKVKSFSHLSPFLIQFQPYSTLFTLIFLPPLSCYRVEIFDGSLKKELPYPPGPNVTKLFTNVIYKCSSIGFHLWVRQLLIEVPFRCSILE